jgi:hypothetical protein
VPGTDERHRGDAAHQRARLFERLALDGTVRHPLTRRFIHQAAQSFLAFTLATQA